ncbi:hypothetical protein [Phyllobacterium sp. YR531]|uniref:hypothetical protein n=1 Tax=Phyllobacterium sp. YR531 TaxID=1144343 RepID=UPI00026F5B50|nr:hypothetical protein [Phyllobacterium sp. YR531]EJN04468.1 hypothetical protein PMI41_02109 [Phyllobacterium sp. YR531]
MTIHSNFVVKREAEIKTGELIKYQTARGWGLGFVLSNAEGRLSVAALRETGQSSLPIHSTFFTSDTILSFGTDYVIELLDSDETWPGNYAAHADGTITLGHNGKILQLSDGRGVGRPNWLDLETMKFSSKADSEGSPVVKWRIWANEQDYNSLKSTPIFEFGTKVESPS